MTGKLLVAVVAAAVSSASAATVGVVFTRVAATHHGDAPAAVGAAASGPVRSAVVLNASESLFESLSGDSSASEGDASSCTDPHGCGGASRGSDVRLNILGSSLTILPIWLGGDTQDAYSNRVAPLTLPEFSPAAPLKVEFHVPRRNGVSDGGARDPQSDSETPAQSGSQDQSGSQNQNATRTDASGQSTVTGSDLGATMELVATPAITSGLLIPGVVAPTVDALTVLASADATPIATPLANYAAYTPPAPVNPVVAPPPWTPSSGGVGAIPEPSTWAMMILGALAVCALKRRRVAAALRSAWS